MKIRLGKRVTRRDEEEDPTERLSKAYLRVGRAEVELAKAKIALESYMGRKKAQNL